MLFKDEILDNLAANEINVAQFASFAPDGSQRYSRVRGFESNLRLAGPLEVALAIYRTQVRLKNVNIRTFLPEKPDGCDFFYGPAHGFEDPSRVAEVAGKKLSEGYYVLVNETVDTNDGGFSGVLFGDVMEFASRDIPRCVEKPGCAVLSRARAFDLVRTVYGFEMRMPFLPSSRIECSVHPLPVGYLGARQIVWQAEDMRVSLLPAAPKASWPNRYSCDMGDKAFGLLMAHLAGFRVPLTHVFGRVIPYFSFGTETHSNEAIWVRTCPRTQQPGLYTTSRGWADPFAIMQREDPDGSKIAAIIVQQGIAARYSGAAITDANGELLVEGKAGEGDCFMVGEQAPEKLPARVVSAVGFLWEDLNSEFGDARFEWVFDGTEAWVVQLHVGRSASSGLVIYPGEASVWHEFDVRSGLEALRKLVEKAAAENSGIVLKGDVGTTSHFGDLLRRNKIPSRLER